MIARGHEVSGNAVEQRRLLMPNLTDFAVHGFRCQNDLRSESLADALVAETNTKDRQLAGRLFDQVEADSGFVRIAGSRREDNSVGAQLYRLVSAEGIVAPNLDLRSQLTQVVAKVIGKTVVVID